MSQQTHYHYCYLPQAPFHQSGIKGGQSGSGSRIHISAATGRKAPFTVSPSSLSVLCVTVEVVLPSFFYAPTPSILFNQVFPSAFRELSFSEDSEPSSLRDAYTE